MTSTEKAKDLDGDDPMDDDEETEDGNVTTSMRAPRPAPRRRAKKVSGKAPVRSRITAEGDGEADADVERESEDSDSDDERIVMRPSRPKITSPSLRMLVANDSTDDIDIDLDSAEDRRKPTQSSTLHFKRPTSFARKSPVSGKALVEGAVNERGSEDDEEEGVEHVVPERVERVELPRFKDFEAAALSGSTQTVTTFRPVQTSESSKMSIGAIVS